MDHVRNLLPALKLAKEKGLKLALHMSEVSSMHNNTVHWSAGCCFSLQGHMDQSGSC